MGIELILGEVKIRQRKRFAPRVAAPAQRGCLARGQRNRQGQQTIDQCHIGVRLAKAYQHLPPARQHPFETRTGGFRHRGCERLTVHDEHRGVGNVRISHKWHSEISQACEQTASAVADEIHRDDANRE